MKMFEINKIFTEKVAEYMANGYVIHPVSMAGSQGEVGKVDLVKGEELIRVWMEDVSSVWGRNPDEYYGGYRYISVGRWNRPASASSLQHDTVWYSDIEVLETVKFYEIQRERWYVDTLEEALRIQELHRARYHNLHDLRYPDTKYITDPRKLEVARKYLKRKYGYQRISMSKLDLRKNTEGTYIVNYNGHDYFMHARKDWRY